LVDTVAVETETAEQVALAVKENYSLTKLFMDAAAASSAKRKDLVTRMVAQEAAKRKQALGIQLSEGEVAAVSGDLRVFVGPLEQGKFHRSILRGYATSSLINNVVMLTISMRSYVNHYANKHKINEKKRMSNWDDLLQNVSWTHKDGYLLSFRWDIPTPTMGDVVEMELVPLPPALARYCDALPSTVRSLAPACREQYSTKNVAIASKDGYSLEVAHYYSEYQAAGCFVTGARWCTPNGEYGDHLCPEKYVSCGSGQALPGTRCYNDSPKFINANQVKGEIVLSPDNMGVVGDFIHVTGVFDTRSIVNSNGVPTPPALRDRLPAFDTASLPNGNVLRDFTGRISPLSKNEMGVVYYSAPLPEPAAVGSAEAEAPEALGVVVPLPAGALARGVAVWCTGSDVTNLREGNDYNPRLPLQRVCKYAEARPVGAVACDSTERAIWLREIGRPNRFSREDVPRLKLPIPPPPRAADLSVSVRRAQTIKDFADRYNTLDSDLSAALASSQGKEVTLLDPSPYGRASFIWKDDKGLRNTTTVLWTGNVVTTKTAK
jgi:hypothetical protein